MRSLLHCDVCGPYGREIPFTRPNTKQTRRAGTPCAAGFTSLVPGTRAKCVLSSSYLLAPSRTRVCPLFPVAPGTFPTNTTDEDGGSQPRFGHATSSRTEASLHSLVCVYMPARKSKVVSCNTHARASPDNNRNESHPMRRCNYQQLSPFLSSFSSYLDM